MRLKHQFHCESITKKVHADKWDFTRFGFKTDFRCCDEILVFLKFLFLSSASFIYSGLFISFDYDMDEELYTFCSVGCSNCNVIVYLYPNFNVELAKPSLKTIGMDE